MLGKTAIILSFLALTNGNDVAEFFGSSIGNGQLAVFIPFVDISLEVNRNNGKRGVLLGIEEENSEIDNIFQGSNSEQYFRLPRADIINNCRSTYFIMILYRSGDNMRYSSETRIDSQDSVTIGNVTDSTIWIYGSPLSYFEDKLSSSNSRYCFSPGDCYREVNLGNLRRRKIEYRLCDGSALSKESTQKIIQVDSVLSEDVLAALEGFKASRNSRNPTPRYPKQNPTRYPTQNPTRYPTPNPIEVSNDIQGFEERWLSAHNTRRDHFYNLFNMDSLDLKWSASVATSAQNYANKLIRRNGCSIQHGYDNDRYGGENLAMNYGRVPRTIEEIMHAWYDDEIDLNAMELVGKKYHASQVIFRSSRYVGCAHAEKDMENGAKCFIQVCRYIGVGNCFIDSQADHPAVAEAFPDNCIAQHPGWVCSVLSDTASNFCSETQCPAEGCI
eukprot:CAMPEP_0194179102 /NCGR_PEP_ID=MMETSP0154-20130528/12611_1 /TAXON_ID=1049557 /ORGANISM="Thalassiothrix antarctica, Strain L6-D1" /LENGTH=443 /DNA_ID=CAMNT_0038894327 /DNA_START=116 /DNA_END=1447 /DNA_ORIENTATION=+